MDMLIENQYRCGPYKLARLLDQCIKRYNLSSENLPPDIVDSESLPKPPSPDKSTTTLPFKTNPNSTPSSDADPYTPPPNHTQTNSDQNLQSSPTARTDHKIACALITDDNPINCRLLVAFMKKFNYGYEVATNGQMALDLYTSGPRRFNFILMDLSMPVMDGMTATRKIRQFEKKQELPRMPIIALTGLASNATRLEAQESGIDAYLTKPVDFARLLGMMDSGGGGEW
jgi:CheY-like chemotaxis protein